MQMGSTTPSTVARSSATSQTAIARWPSSRRRTPPSQLGAIGWWNGGPVHLARRTGTHGLAGPVVVVVGGGGSKFGVGSIASMHLLPSPPASRGSHHYHAPWSDHNSLCLTSNLQLNTSKHEDTEFHRAITGFLVHWGTPHPLSLCVGLVEPRQHPYQVALHCPLHVLAE